MPVAHSPATPVAETPEGDAWRAVAAPALGPILEAAAQAFYESGFHGASVREIAQRAGLTVPSLYYHHDNKEGLLRAVLMASLDPIVENVERARAARSTPPEQLADVVEAVALAMTIDPRLASIDAAEARYLTSPNLDQYVASRDRLDRALQEVLEAGIASGDFELDDAAAARRAILGMLQAIPRWYHVDGPSRPEQIARDYAQLALRLVGARTIESAR